MGWTQVNHNWHTRKQFIENEILVEDFLCDRDGNRVGKVTYPTYKDAGSHVWAIAKLDYDNGTSKEVIVCVLTEGGDTWKTVEESMGPCEIDCPLEYLRRVPLDSENEYAIKWRAKVSKKYNVLGVIL